MVKILIVAHCAIGRAFIEAVEHIMPGESKGVSAFCVEHFKHLVDLETALIQECSDIGDEEGILILTDLVGSSPYNAVKKVIHNDIISVTGLNLPMLLKVLNYLSLPLKALAKKAIEAGQKGVS